MSLTRKVTKPNDNGIFRASDKNRVHSRFNWTVIEKKRAWAVSPPESPKSSIIHARQETTFKRGVRTNTFQDVRAAYLQAFSSGEVGNCLGTSPE